MSLGSISNAGLAISKDQDLNELENTVKHAMVAFCQKRGLKVSGVSLSLSTGFLDTSAGKFILECEAVVR